MEEEKPLGCEHQDLYWLVLDFYQYMQGLQAEPGLADCLILYFFLYMQDLQAEPGLTEQADLQAVALVLVACGAD